MFFLIQHRNFVNIVEIDHRVDPTIFNWKSIFDQKYIYHVS